MDKSAIILAGGLGTRLKSEVSDRPKSMALIQSRPFLECLMDRLIANGIGHFILSVGFGAENIRSHFAEAYRGCAIDYAVEETQLGTGGAIKNAMKLVSTDHVVVVNGDSIFVTDLSAQFELHKRSGADVTLALKPMKDIERYGTVELDSDSRVSRFLEKQPVKEGYINTGTYIFNVQSFHTQQLPEIFSIEKDYFETAVERMNFIGHISDGYFLDIGIPADYKKAQVELGVFPQVDHRWTLFLDRDGVINQKLEDDYVKSLDELTLLPGAIDSIVEFSALFGRLVVVTNQQGIGKKLMTEADLEVIHDCITQQVEEQGGRIDSFYFAPQLRSENSSMRKPAIGMAHKAQADFPEIDFAKSIMVGDSPSDMEFGRNAGMTCILISGIRFNTEHEYALESIAHLSNLLKSVHGSSRP